MNAYTHSPSPERMVSFHACRLSSTTTPLSDDKLSSTYDRLLFINDVSQRRTISAPPSIVARSHSSPVLGRKKHTKCCVVWCMHGIDRFSSWSGPILSWDRLWGRYCYYQIHWTRSSLKWSYFRKKKWINKTKEYSTTLTAKIISSFLLIKSS